MRRIRKRRDEGRYFDSVCGEVCSDSVKMALLSPEVACPLLTGAAKIDARLRKLMSCGLALAYAGAAL